MYEYKVALVFIGEPSKLGELDLLEDQCNKMAQDGWELHLLAPTGAVMPDNGQPAHVAVFRREAK